MSGGLPRIEARDLDLSVPLPKVTLSEDEREWDLAIQAWRRASRFRREADAVCNLRRLSFAQWHVLEATQRLIREKGDAVSQREITRRTQLTKSSVSELVRGLSVRDLVDVRPDCWGISDRIWMTNAGEGLIAALRPLLREVAGGLTKGL